MSETPAVKRSTFRKVAAWLHPPLLSPAGIAVRGGWIVVAFFVAHACGLRDATSILSGTYPEQGGGTFGIALGMLYAILYFAAVVVSPILWIAAGLLAVFDRHMRRAKPALDSRMDRDIEHVKLLSIFHYITAGVALFVGLCPGFYVLAGIMFLVAPESVMHPQGYPQAPGQPPPEVVGWVMLIGGLVFATLLWTSAVLCLIAGRSLATRKRFGLCCLTAGVCCILFPFGTILGVCSFMVLFRPSVKALFTQQHDEWDPHSPDQYPMR